MPTTDTSEKGLELIIVKALTGLSDEQILHVPMAGVREATVGFGGQGYLLGRPQDFDRDHAVDTYHLFEFIRRTQPKAFERLSLGSDGNPRLQFLARLQGEIAKRGTVDVLRKGIKHGPESVALFYGTPSKDNAKAKEQWESNLFSVTRQLCYSKDETKLALDLCVFINGLPIFTFELKNRLTKQTVEHAVEQYKRDRDARELMFHFGKCLAHFAVDDQEVQFCTQIAGKHSWFLPFNKGYNDGAGNPPNPDGIKTDYLWREILTKDGLADILENYAQLVERKDKKTGKVKRDLIFPRYHQRDVVRKLLADCRAQGAGQRYLIQHSAGSGKSNSIAWLAHQLVGLEEGSTPIFDSVVVVTDRVILDGQIRDTIKQFTQRSGLVGHAEGSGDLKRFIQGGTKIIITTVQKFPYVLSDIGSEHKGSKFAIIIDEAHSSQSGQTASKMNRALSGAEDEDYEDEINKIMESRKMLPNASYFAFTATPKNKTLEMFGVPVPQPDGTNKYVPFHSYTMKQAIQERFILDVLENYTPYPTYVELVKRIQDDPEFDKKKAHRKLKAYVENHPDAIRTKAEIMVDHFHDEVVAKRLIDGKARAMVVTGSIKRAIEYFRAIQAYLIQRKSPYRALVAFSGEHEIAGEKVTESTMNGFASNKIADEFQEEPYRFLICADKFQTGYDEPLLHTMYVDKTLSGIKAVQTLSRLNRARPGKYNTFVLDFANDAETIQEAFQPYYRTTILSRETDPNKLHDLKADLDARHVYDDSAVDSLVDLFLKGADRDKLDPILDHAADLYVQNLDEDQQVDFKGKAKAFVRTYTFLASILPYSNADWEKLSIFLNFLIPKLPAPEEPDLAKGILEAIDMDTYRAEKRSTIKIILEDSDAEIEPVPTTGGGRAPEPEMDFLSNIVQEFNDRFGGLFDDPEQMAKVISEELPPKVLQNQAYANAVASGDKENARLEHDKVLRTVIAGMMKDHLELFKLYSSNSDFKQWLAATNFQHTYAKTETPSQSDLP